MRKLILSLFVVVALSGCSTVSKYWPRAHDPVLVSSWADTWIALEQVNCSAADTGWSQVRAHSGKLWLLADFRKDPQADNLKGLRDHSDRMLKSTNKTFCEIGVKTAQARLSAARGAWEGR